MNGRTRKGASALHLAAQQGKAATGDLLLRRRADPCARNRKDQTPLDLCKDEGMREALQAAIDAKATAAAAAGERSPHGLGLRVWVRAGPGAH